MDESFELFDTQGLLSILRHALESPEPGRDVALVVGSALSRGPVAGGTSGSCIVGVPDVEGVIGLLAQESEKRGWAPGELLERLPQDGNRYQSAFESLKSRTPLKVADRVVRQAVLRARTDALEPADLASVLDGNTETCKHLEEQLDRWNLPSGVMALGRIARQYPNLGPILTTNFDPLLKIAIEASGGRCARMALDGDGTFQGFDAKGSMVVHLHGYWYGTTTLHTAAVLTRTRRALGAALRHLLRSTSLLVVLGYGGWSDAFMDALESFAADTDTVGEVRWAFYEKSHDEIVARYPRLLEIKRAQLVDRIQFHGGVDVHQLLPALARELQLEVHEEAQLLGIGALPLDDDLPSIRPPERPVAPSFESLERAWIRRHKRQNAGQEPPNYEISSVFQLTSDAAGAQKRLKARSAEWNDADPTNLLSRRLTIRCSYTAPLQLLTGIITELDRDWPPIVHAHRKLATESSSHPLRAFHYYVEFCWLAWGPSVSTLLLEADDRLDVMVLQVAFGDEANSLPLVVPKAVWRDKLQALINLTGSLRLEGLLVVDVARDEFFRGLRDHAFLQDLFQGGIALYFDEASRAEPLPVGPCYSTAYTWLMLEQVTRDTMAGRRSESLKPGAVLPFFEHTNLACKQTLDFFQHCLARKALYYILDVARNEPEHGFYRYATALFDESMAGDGPTASGILQQELMRLPPSERAGIAERLFIPPIAERHTAQHVVDFVCALHDEVDRAGVARSPDSLRPIASRS